MLVKGRLNIIRNIIIKRPINMSSPPIALSGYNNIDAFISCKIKLLKISIKEA